MRKWIIPIVTLLAIGAGATLYAAVTAGRPDCPGTITCPLSGEPVCKDRCPLGEQALANQTTELPACCGVRK